MTDTPKTKLDRLTRTEAAIQAKLDGLLQSPDTDDNPPDKWARSISTLMKALDDTAQQRAALEAHIAAKTHTRYEDMPPPTPEDEARFDALFKKLYDSIDDEGKIKDPLG
jgi:hypothetical protein